MNRKSRTYGANNKEKQMIATEKWAKSNPRKIRNARLIREYGLNIGQYDAMLREQNYACAICKGTEITKSKNGSIRALAVDHCHITGKVRGLLCTSCNHGIGKLKDSIQILTNSIEYLKKHGDK